jgi:hypothetical protein
VRRFQQSKDAFDKHHQQVVGLLFLKLIKFIASAAIPDAEEAMPELCGKVFSVSIVK